MSFVLVPGHVVYLYCSSINPPKKKFFVVVAITPLMMFPINTKRPQLPNLHRECVEIDRIDHVFLKYDSWICCNETFGGYTKEQIEAIVDNSPFAHKGDLSLQVKLNVISVVANSYTLPKKKINLIVGALGGGCGCGPYVAGAYPGRP